MASRPPITETFHLSSPPEEEPCCQTREEGESQTPGRGSWWRPLARQDPGLVSTGTHLCFTSLILPCLFVVSLVLCLLASKYEHLAEAAQMVLNTTLLLTRAKLS